MRRIWQRHCYEWGLERQKLADRAFRSPASTARLNQITHPAILRELERRIMCYKSPGPPLLLSMPRCCSKAVWSVTAMSLWLWLPPRRLGKNEL
ncbi:MAG: dephospho-CoA kinase [Hydrogeniiclostridium mannosilyticum]